MVYQAMVILCQSPDIAEFFAETQLRFCYLRKQLVARPEALHVQQFRGLASTAIMESLRLDEFSEGRWCGCIKSTRPLTMGLWFGLNKCIAITKKQKGVSGYYLNAVARLKKVDNRSCCL